jgi:hypothetical protein
MSTSWRDAPAAATSAAFLVSAGLVALRSPWWWAPLAALLVLSLWFSVTGRRT